MACSTWLTQWGFYRYSVVSPGRGLHIGTELYRYVHLVFPCGCSHTDHELACLRLGLITICGGAATVVEGGNDVHLIQNVPGESGKLFVDDCSFRNGMANCTVAISQSGSTVTATTAMITATLQDVQVRYSPRLSLRIEDGLS